MDTNKAKQIWAKACEFLLSAVSADVYHRWIGVIEAVGDEKPGQLTLTVPNGFYHDWLEEHYLPLIRKALGVSGMENLDDRLSGGQYAPTAGNGGRAPSRRKRNPRAARRRRTTSGGR